MTTALTPTTAVQRPGPAQSPEGHRRSQAPGRGWSLVAIQYSAMFGVGLLTREVSRFRAVRVQEIVAPVPPEIVADASLVEVAYTMLQCRARRLIVTDHGEMSGSSASKSCSSRWTAFCRGIHERRDHE